jgi:acetyl-CoA carboxylase biotin carboxyl carrier protein
MTNKEIKELLQIFDESGIAEMEVQRGENRLRLRRALTAQEMVVPVAAAPAPVAALPVATPHTPALVKPAAVDPNQITVKSPIVGTYYDSPSPGASAFVKVGDSVEPGQVLCIIESMKLMNEIEAEVAGTLVHKLCENGHAVEYGEALFAIRPR